MKTRTGAVCLAAMVIVAAAFGQESVVNYESSHVSPLAINPAGGRLAACNTLDGRVEFFDVTSGVPSYLCSLPVGLDPVSVRFRTNSEIWVVNQISDTISILDIVSGIVRKTLHVLDEPADVEFAGNPQRAFVTCSGANSVLVYDPADLDAAPTQIVLEEDAPRMMRKSPDGLTVYAAFFEAGNSTVLDGDAVDAVRYPWQTNAVDAPEGPYSGQNPPPQLNDVIEPAVEVNPELPPFPRSSLSMTFGETHSWEDGQERDWAPIVTGDLAHLSGRPTGWHMADHGLAVIDANTLAVTYADNLATVNAAFAVSPIDGTIALSGLRLFNYVRFEANVQGNFGQIPIFFWDKVNGRHDPDKVFMLNRHLTRHTHILPPSERLKSIGDPRGAVYRADGQRIYFIGMGSNNIVVINTLGFRAGLSSDSVINVGQGPTGIVLDSIRSRLYVLNRFEATISVVSTETEQEVSRVPFFDPTPEAVKLGRPFLYDTHLTSGTGQASCANCHIDAKSDKHGWDLGAPHADMAPLPDVVNPGGGIPGIADDLQPFHPVKGVMFTQTLQDIIGKEPHHWRADRAGIEAFNPAFTNLLGRDEELTEEEMQQFEDFLATITFPPNPDRNDDNTLPTDLDLGDLRSVGVFGSDGQLLPHGNAQRGLELFRTADPRSGEPLHCASCHTLTTGGGTNSVLDGGEWVPIPDGPLGEKHHALVSNIGGEQKTFKVAQLRSVRDKTGFTLEGPVSRRGFGFLHDGSIDTLARFLSDGHFAVTQSDQDVADLAAFLLSFSGSGIESTPDEPPGTPSKDSHAATGMQATVDSAAKADDIDYLIGLVDGSSRIELVARYVADGVIRGAVYLGDSVFQTDRADETLAIDVLLALAAPGAEQTYTIVAAGTETRIGLDRDEDGLYNFDETRDINGAENPFDRDSADSTGDAQGGPDGTSDGDNDYDADGLTNADEFARSADPLVEDTDGDTLADGAEVNEHGTDPTSADSDSDDLGDAVEITLGTDPVSADSDEDGLDDGDEVNTHNTDPVLADTDSDGLSDGNEIDVSETNPVNADSDGDSLPDGEEVNTHDTDPNSADSDEDGLNDAAELNTHDTDPNVGDSDGDTLTDGAEINTHGSDPNAVDSDGDSLADGAEVNVHGTDPASDDTDDDALPDDWELDNALSPVEASGEDGADGDPDGDGVTNAAELAAGSDPQVAEDGPGCSAGSSTGAGANRADVALLLAAATMLLSGTGRGARRRAS